MQRNNVDQHNDICDAEIYNNSEYSHLQHHFEDEVFFHYIVPREEGKHAGKDVVEFGCGTGYLTEKILRSLNSATVTGIDNSTSMLEKAREKYSGNHSVLFQRYNLASDS